MTSEGSRFRQYVGLARDLAISAAVLAYFVGFVYIYYYFGEFGLGVLASKLDIQLVYVFAWEVVRREYVFALSLVGAILVFGICFNYAIETLADPETIASRIENTMRKMGTPVGDTRLLRRLLRLLGSLISVVPVFAMFLILAVLFDWSGKIATEDANDRFRAAHLGVRTSVELVEETPGEEVTRDVNGTHAAFDASSERSIMDARRRAKLQNDAAKRQIEGCMHGTNEFDTVEPSNVAELLQKINAASSCGRVVPVAETDDRVVVLVSTPNPDLENPAKRDPGDRVYLIERKLIAAEELWSR